MDGAVIAVEDRDGVQVVRLTRTEKANALTAEHKVELAGLVAERSRLPGTRAFVVTGQGRYFCAGSDVAEMARFSTSEMQTMLSAESGLYRSLLASPRPVLAAVNGFALGGGLALAACCDWVVASDEAVFGLPELGVGVAVSLEGALLPWLAGLGHARRLFYDPQARLDAVEALRLGLVHEVVPPERLLEAALARARAIGALPPAAFALQKRMILSLLLTGAGEAVVEISRQGTPLLLTQSESRRALSLAGGGSGEEVP